MVLFSSGVLDHDAPDFQIEPIAVHSVRLQRMPMRAKDLFLLTSFGECKDGPVGTCETGRCPSDLGPTNCTEGKCVCAPGSCATEKQDFCAPPGCVATMSEQEESLDNLEREISQTRAELAVTDSGGPTSALPQEPVDLQPQEIEEMENYEEDLAARATGWNIVATYANFTRALQRNMDMITKLYNTEVIPKIRPTVDALREETSEDGLGEQVKKFAGGLQNVANYEKEGNFNLDRITSMAAGDIPEVMTPMINELTDLRNSATMLKRRLQGISNAASILEGKAEAADAEATRVADVERKAQAQKKEEALKLLADSLPGASCKKDPLKEQISPGHGVEVVAFDPGVIQKLPQERLAGRGYPPAGDMSQDLGDSFVPRSDRANEPKDIQTTLQENADLDARLLQREGQLPIEYGGVNSPNVAAHIAASFASSVEALRHRTLRSALGTVKCPSGAAACRRPRSGKRGLCEHRVAGMFL